MATSSIVDRMISKSSVPARPTLSNLNAVLADVYVRHVALKQEDCQLYYKVYTQVFYRLHELMKQVDPYYERYSSAIKFAGSHYDRLRINKPDEYDLVIGINVPVNMKEGIGGASDIAIEPTHPGYVQLRAGVQYQKLLVRDGADCVVNRTAHHWLDERNYITRSKFADWFKGVVNKALARLSPNESNRPCIEIAGVLYQIRTTEGGPALTLVIEDTREFKLDVDLVPALIFPDSRWPVAGYRAIPPACHVGTWILVPKPNKHGYTVHDERRSWRIGLQEQERKLIHNSYNLRLTNKLLKKLRDSRGMTKIASYYIKTLFLWEREGSDERFWCRNDLTTLFKHMLRKFHNALVEGRISYFWNRRYNLIGHVSKQVLNGYANIVANFLRELEEIRGHEKAAKYLLTEEEWQSYKMFFQK
ncbi:unnamed protein product, partial [Iphiclides podalirius]